MILPTQIIKNTKGFYVEIGTQFKWFMQSKLYQYKQIHMEETSMALKELKHLKYNWWKWFLGV